MPLRYAHLERLVVDVRSRARQIHMQRIHYFELVNPDHLVDEVFHMLCQWYPHSDGVDGAKWAKFAREMTLVPNITDPVRAAQVDIAYKRQFKSSDGKIQKGGRLDPAGLKEALIEISFIRFPVWQDPEKEAKEERAKAEEEARKKAEEEDVEDAVEEPILHIEPKVEQHDDLSLEGALAGELHGPEDASLVTEDEGVETAEGIHINTADALHHRHEVEERQGRVGRVGGPEPEGPVPPRARRRGVADASSRRRTSTSPSPRASTASSSRSGRARARWRRSSRRSPRT